MTKLRYLATYRAAFAGAISLALASCGHVPPAQAPPVTQQRPLPALLVASAYPNSDTLLVLVAMQQLMATHREWEGYQYFGRLAEEQPNRRALFRSLQATMQARVANDVPLLQRVAWVQDAIRKLDEGAAADPGLGRLARGLVFADLPSRFGKSKQAIEDLEWCLAHPVELPLGLNRGIYRALARAYRTSGDEHRSQELLARAGLPSLDDPGVPSVLADLSVDAKNGFKFGQRRLVREAEGVYVAEGYDFSNLTFIVANGFVVAIDAGTTEESARDAVAALRRVTKAPIKYVIFTHGHWDHVGGITAVREPGTILIARDNFAEELQRSNDYPGPFRWFFGTGKITLNVKPDRLLSRTETLTEGGLDLAIIPAKSGETPDALFIHDRKHDILFVGDAFMPYVGAPFVPEGSPEGFLGAISMVLDLHPRRLVHGHVPLTAIFTMEAMPGLRDAFSALYERTLTAARAARPLADVLHDDFLPDSLRAAPAAVQPYLIARDQFVQRLYLEHAGYWQSNGDGIDLFTRGEWAAALDSLGGGSDDAFARVARELEARGDAALALQIADLGLVRHPSSSALREIHGRALRTLQEIHSQVNPFRFIVDSEWAGRGLDPVVEREPAPPPPR